MIEQCIIEIGPCESVMSEIKSLLRSHKPNEGTMWLTPFQQSGRGQAGNSWQSEPGLNLLLGMVLYPDFIDPTEQFLVSKVIALALTDVLGQYTTDISIKWPNDIYWKDKKVAGILIEGSLVGDKVERMIVGAGINVLQTTFDSSIPNPVSLKNITGIDFDLKQLAEDIHETILFWYNELKIDKDKINSLYQDRLLGYQTERKFKDADGEFMASIIDVESSGRLCLVDSGNNTRYYWFKEIEHIFG